MADEGGEKTEEASDKKIQDSRKQGQVWKSKDLTGVFVFLVGLGIVKGTWSGLETKVNELFQFTFEHMTHPEDIQKATLQCMLLALMDLLVLTVPVAMGCALIGGLVEFLQVGALFTMDPLIPKLEKLNPIEGLKNMVNKQKIIELIKNLLKLGVTGKVVYGTVQDALGLVVATINADPHGTMDVMGELVQRITIKVGLLLFGFAIVDVFLQRRAYFKNLMMTKEDQKKEYKESEGDPHHKAHRKQMHMEIMEGAQMEHAKSADAIVTNPDHLALALKYDKEKDNAPRLIAKGMGVKAEKLRELARAYDIPMIRNVPLAHSLWRVEIGEEIPEELYDAVAEVLNFVYSMKNAPPPPVKAQPVVAS